MDKTLWFFEQDGLSVSGVSFTENFEVWPITRRCLVKMSLNSKKRFSKFFFSSSVSTLPCQLKESKNVFRSSTLSSGRMDSLFLKRMSSS